MERWVWTLRFSLIIFPIILCISTPPPNPSPRTYKSTPMPPIDYETILDKDDPDIPVDKELLAKVQSDMLLERKRLNSESQDYSEDDLFCLAVGIGQEAGGDAQSDYTREMVGRVILNRVNDPRFPNSIREVLTAEGQYGRLHHTGVRFPEYCNEDMIKRAYKIAEIILSGHSTVYCPSNVVWQSSFKQGDGVLTISDDIYFCYSNW